MVGWVHDHGRPHDGHDDTMRTMDFPGKNSWCSSCHRTRRESTVTVTVLVLGSLLWTSPLSAQSLFSERVAVEFASAITTSSPTPDWDHAAAVSLVFAQRVWGS